MIRVKEIVYLAWPPLSFEINHHANYKTDKSYSPPPTYTTRLKPTFNNQAIFNIEIQRQNIAHSASHHAQAITSCLIEKSNRQHQCNHIRATIQDEKTITKRQ